MEFDRIEALRIGQELKKIRKQRGLSLAEVESLSTGRWKAVVVGSYERADRAITIGRLSALMAFYQAPVSALFQLSIHTHDQERSEQPVTFDLRKRDEMAKKYPALHQFIQHTLNARGDWNGHIVTLRSSDLQVLAICSGKSVVDYAEELRLSQLLLQWR